MGSIASTNPAATSTSSSNGLADLMQTLSNENSPLLSTLSSPNIQSALETAPASDIVEISEQAMQLQATDALFGISDTSSTSPDDSLFSALADTSSTTSSSASDSTLSTGSSLADQLAAYQSNMQVQDTQALFGNPSTTTTNSNSAFDVFA